MADRGRRLRLDSTDISTFSSFFSPPIARHGTYRYGTILTCPLVLDSFFFSFSIAVMSWGWGVGAENPRDTLLQPTKSPFVGMVGCRPIVERRRGLHKREKFAEFRARRTTDVGERPLKPSTHRPSSESGAFHFGCSFTVKQPAGIVRVQTLLVN